MNFLHFNKDPYQITLARINGLNDADVERVVNYLSERYQGESFLSETRAVIISACSNLKYNGIKIKGCGFEGGPVQFGKSHKYAYSLPRYDYEGNYSRDQAKDFERAYSGGMTYQQARQEFMVSSYLIERNFDTFSPLGYGVIKKDGLQSWFCFLNAPFAHQAGANSLFSTNEDVKTTAAFLAKSQIELHSLGIYLILSGTTKVDGKLIRKDFHTCVMASSGESFMSRLCYFLFDVNFILYLFVGEKGFSNVKHNQEKSYLACKEYIRGLTGLDATMQEIMEFRKLLVHLKENSTMDIYERLKILQRDHIANQILMGFLSEEEKAEFL